MQYKIGDLVRIKHLGTERYFPNEENPTVLRITKLVNDIGFQAVRQNQKQDIPYFFSWVNWNVEPVLPAPNLTDVF